MKQAQAFSFWKKPWHKWLILSAAVLQIIALWFEIKDFSELYQIKDSISSDTQWQNFVENQFLQILLSVFLIALFLGCFIIGFFAHSQKAAYTLMGIILLAFSLAWGIVGFLMKVTLQNSSKIVWLATLTASLIGSIYVFWKRQKA